MSNSPAENYVSPYGFSPVTDIVIDVIAERRGISTYEIEGHIEWLRSKTAMTDDGDESTLDEVTIPAWYVTHMGPAIDALEDILYPKDIDDDGMEGA